MRSLVLAATLLGVAGSVAVGSHHRYLAHCAEAFGEYADARCIHAIIVTYQNSHVDPSSNVSGTAGDPCRRCRLKRLSLTERRGRFMEDDVLFWPRGDCRIG